MLYTGFPLPDYDSGITSQFACSRSWVRILQSHFSRDKLMFIRLSPTVIMVSIYRYYRYFHHLFGYFFSVTASCCVLTQILFENLQRSFFKLLHVSQCFSNITTYLSFVPRLRQYLIAFLFTLLWQICVDRVGWSRTETMWTRNGDIAVHWETYAEAFIFPHWPLM